MLAEGQARAEAAGIANIDWLQADAATATLDGFDLLASNFGVMFFGDPVAAFAHMRRAASPSARMAFVCWRPITENPWMEVPLHAVYRHVPRRPKPDPQAPGMFAFANPQRSTRYSPQPAGRRRGSTSSTSIWTSPPVAGWRRLWISRPKSAPSTGRYAASRRMPSQPPSYPSGRRWRRIWTARACACPVWLVSSAPA
jgi:SAM-dependent methyltransferase